jgi:hypothetical protein
MTMQAQIREVQTVWRYAYWVRLTAQRTIHLQFDVSANALEIRAVQSPKCIV